ncbi:MAG TPA: hypothetical protein VIW29_02175 [Polyangiaceae bacterium]
MTAGLGPLACSSAEPVHGNSAGQPGSGTAGSGAGGTGQAGTSTGGTTGGTNPLPTGGGIGGAGTGGSSSQAGGGAGTGGTGSAGTGGGAGDGSTRSPGCDKDVAEDPSAWTTHDITVAIDPKLATAYGQRRYWTRPPMNYDKTKPIPLTIWAQGCNQGNNPEDTPMTIGPAADGSVQVELLAPQNHPGPCYYAGPDGDDAKTPELPYFDEVLSEALNNYCIDTSKVFVGGYSSGGWLTSLVSCNRASVVRGVGWAAAGLQLNHDACSGPVAAIITRGMNDAGTPLAQTEAARDSLIMRNGCTMSTAPWRPGETMFNSSSCVEYQGCMPGYPVVWCPTPGGHTNTVMDTKLSPQGFWKFWTSL